MEIKIYEVNSSLLIKLRGRVVLDECDRLKSTTLATIQPGIGQVYLDLSEVDFIDSAGLGALVGIKVSSNKHRAKLQLINPSRQVGDILMVSKLDSIFEISSGQEADTLVRQMSAPQFEKRVGSSAPPAPAARGPAMPVMPAAAPPMPSGPKGAATPKDRIDQLCKEAVEHMKRGDYNSAVQAYVQALEINPDYLPAHNNLAIVYEKIPQWQEKAIAQWKKVLEISSRNNDQKHIDRAQKHLQNLQKLGIN